MRFPHVLLDEETAPPLGMPFLELLGKNLQIDFLHKNPQRFLLLLHNYKVDKHVCWVQLNLDGTNSENLWVFCFTDKNSIVS